MTDRFTFMRVTFTLPDPTLSSWMEVFISQCVEAPYLMDEELFEILTPIVADLPDACQSATAPLISSPFLLIIETMAVTPSDTGTIFQIVIAPPVSPDEAKNRIENWLSPFSVTQLSIESVRTEDLKADSRTDKTISIDLTGSAAPVTNAYTSLPEEGKEYTGNPIEDLQIALEYDDLEKIKDRIDAGDIPEDALHRAIRSDANRIARHLLECPFTIEHVDGTGNTALSIAVQNHAIPIVEILLGKGANPNVCVTIEALDADDLSFEDNAFDDVLGDVFENLDEEPDDNESPELPRDMWERPVISGNTTPLISWVACDGRADILGMLLEKGADPSVADMDGRTPLHYAVYSDKTDVAACLLDKGVDPNLPDNAGDYPLHIAIYRGKTDMVKLLCTFKADATATNRGGETPLALATRVETYHGNAIKTVLIEAGAA